MQALNNNYMDTKHIHSFVALAYLEKVFYRSYYKHGKQSVVQ